MNVDKKMIGVLAITMAIVVISAVTLPALAASDTAGQGADTQADTCDQTQARTQARIRDGSCGNGSGAAPADGSQKQNRFCYGATNGCGQGASQRYQNGNGSPS